MGLDHFTTLCKWEHAMGFLDPIGEVLNVCPSSCLDNFRALGVLDTLVARIYHYEYMRETSPIAWTGRLLGFTPGAGLVVSVCSVS